MTTGTIHCHAILDLVTAVPLAGLLQIATVQVLCCPNSLKQLMIESFQNKECVVAHAVHVICLSRQIHI